MANTPISMSGVISLDAQQTELLTTLGLEVPPMMTREHFVQLLAQADRIADGFSMDLVARITRVELAPDGHPKSPTCGHLKLLHLN